MRKIALISGSHKGLGLAIARAMARSGEYVVIISSRKYLNAQRSKSQLESEGLFVHACQLDVDDDASVEACMSYIEHTFGRLDVLVNNAGVYPHHNMGEASLQSVDFNVLLATINTNALGMLRLTRACLLLMRRNDYGRIVNVSSEMASMGQMSFDAYPLAPSYRCSKVLMNALTQLLARELEGSDILVNAYSPGWMNTDMGGEQAPYSADEGAETALYLAALPSGSPSGEFYAEMRRFGGPVRLPW